MVTKRAKAKIGRGPGVDLELARSAHDHLLYCQRRMRKARQDYQIPFDQDSMFVLMLLTLDKTLSATDLSRILVQKKSRVSRVLFRLEQQGLIEAVSSKEDRRVKELSFTAQGQIALDELNRINQDISYRGIYPLNDKERDIFARLFKKLNDGLGFPHLVTAPGENPFWVEQRRIGTSSGMTGTNYMKTGLELVEYQLLFELRQSSKALRFSEIAEALPFHSSKISRAATAFSERGIITKTSSKADRRSVYLELSPEGRKYFKKIDDVVAKRYQAALEGIDLKDLNDFISLMKSIVPLPIPPPTPRETSLSICRSEQDYMLARKVLVECLVAEGRHENLSSELIPETHFCVLYHLTEKSCGVLSISPEQVLSCFEFKRLESSSRANVRTQLEKGIALYLKESSASEVQVPAYLQERLSLPPSMSNSQI